MKESREPRSDWTERSTSFGNEGKALRLARYPASRCLASVERAGGGSSRQAIPSVLRTHGHRRALERLVLTPNVQQPREARQRQPSNSFPAHRQGAPRSPTYAKASVDRPTFFAGATSGECVNARLRLWTAGVSLARTHRSPRTTLYRHRSPDAARDPGSIDRKVRKIRDLRRNGSRVASRPGSGERGADAREIGRIDW